MGIVARLNTTSSIGRATIKSTKATIVAPDYKPKPNIALAEIVDVTATGAQDGYGLIYSSANSRYEIKEISVASVPSVSGGTF